MDVMLGERLAKSRKRAGLAQVDRAVALGDRCDQTVISAVEHNRSSLRLGGAVKAAQTLNVSLDYLTGLTDDPTPSAELTAVAIEPTLPDGCSNLVDRASRRRRAGRIFVIRTGDGLIVKRAGKNQAAGWRLESDHPAWSPVPWPADAEVIGHVMWTGRTL